MISPSFFLNSLFIPMVSSLPWYPSKLKHEKVEFGVKNALNFYLSLVQKCQIKSGSDYFSVLLDTLKHTDAISTLS